MCYTIEEVKKLFNEACSSQNVKVVVPIEENGRLSTTLGRVKYKRNMWDEYEPISVEFSKSFLKKAKDYDIEQVVLHEASHYIVLMQTKEKHGHDGVFKEMCSKLGCVFNKTRTDIEYEETEPEKHLNQEEYKYIVYCPSCKKIIAKRKRKCKLVTEIWRYKCSSCGCGELIIK